MPPMPEPEPNTLPGNQHKGGIPDWQFLPYKTEDGRLGLRVVVGHSRWITSRAVRRGVMWDARWLFKGYPDLDLDFVVECDPDATCCAMETIRTTRRRISDSLRDWLPFAPAAAEAVV